MSAIIVRREVPGVLPLTGFHLQGASWGAFPWAALMPAFLLGYAGNLSTALPDYPSDRASGKRSYPVRRGQRRARRDSVLLIAAAALLTPLAAPHEGTGRWAWMLGAMAWLPLAPNLRSLPHAYAEAREACTRFVLLNGAAISLCWLGWIAALLA